MERFTHKSDGYYAVSDDVCYEDQNEEYSGPAIERLAAYEDTMLTPRQIKDADDFLKENYQLRVDSLIHAYDLLKAEQEGRLAVFPCKVRDTVYWADSVIHVTPEPMIVLSFQILGNGNDWICCEDREFRVSSIGKTVFLTREEAEAALKEVPGNGL